MDDSSNRLNYHQKSNYDLIVVSYICIHWAQLPSFIYSSFSFAHWHIYSSELWVVRKQFRYSDYVIDDERILFFSLIYPLIPLEYLLSLFSWISTPASFFFCSSYNWMNILFHFIKSHSYSRRLRTTYPFSSFLKAKHDRVVN